MIRRAFLALVVAAPAGMARAQDMFTLKPIVKAVREGDDEKVRQALLKGENPNQNDTSGQPLLMVAVMAGQITVVETLLKGGAIVDATDREGYTSLFQAAQRGGRVVSLPERLLQGAEIVVSGRDIGSDVAGDAVQGGKANRAGEGGELLFGGGEEEELVLPDRPSDTGSELVLGLE